MSFFLQCKDKFYEKFGLGCTYQYCKYKMNQCKIICAIQSYNKNQHEQSLMYFSITMTGFCVTEHRSYNQMQIVKKKVSFKKGSFVDRKKLFCPYNT